MRNRLSKKQRQKVERVAAVLWLLPKKLRYRFFSAFHPDLRRFFSEVERETLEPATTVEISGSMHIRWVEDRAEAELTFDLAPARFKVRLSRAGRFRIEVDNECVEELISAVKKMRKAERDYLWTLMDEALVDYEDYLLAARIKLIRKHEEASSEIEQGNYIKVA
jgi:hypothetical protein